MSTAKPESILLLQQVRAAIGCVAGATGNGEHQALLACADVVLNELMLRAQGASYLPFIARGLALVAQGEELLSAEDGGKPFALAAPVSEQSAPDVLLNAINRIAAALSAIIRQIDDRPGTMARDFCDRVCDWEASIYAHSLNDAGNSAPPEADPFTRDAFQAYLRRRFPEWGNPRITSYTVLTGGFSKRTILFEIEADGHGRRSLILRAERAVSLPRFSDIVQEYHLADYLVEAGLPTPAPVWLETDLGHFGWAFAIIEKAEGLNYGWTMGRRIELTDPLVTSIIDTLGAMHSVPIRHDDQRLAQSHLAIWRDCTTVTEATRFYVSTYMEGLISQTGIEPSPELVRAMKWLQANVPDVSDPPVLVHHDFGLNNILIDGERVSAILDWESAIVVDPAYDILVMQRELAGAISLEEFLDRYHARTGRRITACNMAYAKVAAFAIYMIVYLNGRQSLVRDDKTPIAMSLLAFKYIAQTAAQLNALIAEAESLFGKGESRDVSAV
jgi:aminoglycoside phosphotransferase (APT) family kinase protein